MDMRKARNTIQKCAQGLSGCYDISSCCWWCALGASSSEDGDSKEQVQNEWRQWRRRRRRRTTLGMNEFWRWGSGKFFLGLALSYLTTYFGDVLGWFGCSLPRRAIPSHVHILHREEEPIPAQDETEKLQKRGDSLLVLLLLLLLLLLRLGLPLLLLLLRRGSLSSSPSLHGLPCLPPHHHHYVSKNNSIYARNFMGQKRAEEDEEELEDENTKIL